MSAAVARQPVAAQPHGEYDYNPMHAMRRRIALYCGKNKNRYNSMTEALRILGQYCVDEKLEGRLSYDEAREVLGREMHRTTYTRQLFWLLDCGLIIEEDNGRYFRILDYTRKNRTLEKWREVKEERRTFWRQSKRAQRQKNASKQGAGRTIEAAREGSEVPNSANVLASLTSIKKTPPPPPAKAPNGGGGLFEKQNPPPPPPESPEPAEQEGARAEGLSKIDAAGVLTALFAKAESASEAQSAKLRAVFDAAPEPVQPAPQPPEPETPDEFETNSWVLKMRAKSRARHGREVDEAYATEQLTPKSRPAEVQKLERVPITAAQLDALCDVPDAMRQEILAGGYTHAEVKRVYDAARQDPHCRMPSRVLLYRLKAGRGRRP